MCVCACACTRPCVFGRQRKQTFCSISEVEKKHCYMRLHEPIIYSTNVSPWRGGVGLIVLGGGCFVGSLPVVQLVLCGSPVVFLFSAGTKENGVINYLVSAGLRRESASINSNCLSFSVEERADTQHPCTHSIRPPENAAGGTRCLKDSDFKPGFSTDERFATLLRVQRLFYSASIDRH